MTTEQQEQRFNREGEGELAARFTLAQRHAEPLKFKGAPRDDVVRITRYKNGAVVEVIEKRIRPETIKRKGRAKRKASIKNWPSKTARTLAKLAKEKRKARAIARAERIIAARGDDEEAN